MDRRLKILLIDADWAIRYFAGLIEDRPLKFEGLPADSRVVSVSPEWGSGTFQVMIHSETFDLVPETEQIPRWRLLEIFHYGVPGYLTDGTDLELSRRIE